MMYRTRAMLTGGMKERAWIDKAGGIQFAGAASCPPARCSKIEANSCGPPGSRTLPLRERIGDNYLSNMQRQLSKVVLIQRTKKAEPRLKTDGSLLREAFLIQRLL